jgi:hypothetical protein
MQTYPVSFRMLTAYGRVAGGDSASISVNKSSSCSLAISSLSGRRHKTTASKVTQGESVLYFVPIE